MSQSTQVGLANSAFIRLQSLRLCGYSNCKKMSNIMLKDPKPAALPRNVSLYTGQSKSELLQATLFTRLATTVEDHAILNAAMGSECAKFCIQHHNILIIFGNDQDAHHEHFRMVCLKLKEHDFGIQYGGCVFDATSALQAGFQLDGLNENTIR
jgi:hypothetical protein